MQYRILGKTGMKVSALSFGASSLGGAFRNVNEADCLQAVAVSLDLGINFIDVSPFYGLTKAETILGKALKGVPREKYFLATKVGRYGFEPKDFDFSARRVTASVDESLSRLGLNYVDLMHAHDIEFGDVKQVMQETIPALGKLRQAGKIRFIGVTGLPLAALMRVADGVEIDAILSYCHYELNDTALADCFRPLRAKGIGIINASPLGMGLLSNRGAPAWHPAPQRVKQVCAQAAAHCAARGTHIEKLALQFALANPDIATTLVGSANPDNMRRNIVWAGEPMDPELLADVLEILKPIHNVTWPSGRPENNS
jgi:aryl-alcohol dehydrogenase-like predicted oxidoreductase